MNNTNSTTRTLCSVFIWVAAALFLLPGLYTLILSVTNFRPVDGLLGSSSAGIKHFENFFRDPEIVFALKNTILISIIGAVVGALYVFLASVSIISIKNQYAKGAVALAFSLPAILPVMMICNIIPVKMLIGSAHFTKFCAAIIGGLRFAGLFSLLAFFLRGDAIKEGTKCLLIYVALKLAFILSPDFASIFGLQNAFTQLDSETLATIIYRHGIMGGDYSAVSAIEVMQSVIQFIPAVLGCLLLMFIHCKKDTQRIRVQGSSSGFALFSISAVIPALIFIVVLVTGSSLFPTLDYPAVSFGYFNGFIMAFGSAVLVAGISWGLAILARNAVCGTGFIALMVLCFTGNHLIGTYILIHGLGALDTVRGVVLYNLNMVPVIALLMTCATYQERSIKKDLAVFLCGFVMLFAYFFGDITSTLVMVTDPELHTISYLVMRLIKESELANQMAMSNGMKTIPLLSSLPVILIPVIVAAAGFLCSAIFKQDKNTLY